MHTLITIGCTGDRTAYLDVPREEAIRRFIVKKNEGMPPDCQSTELDTHERITEMAFIDEFQTYD